MKLRYVAVSALAIGALAVASPAIAEDSVSVNGSGGGGAGAAESMSLKNSSGTTVATGSFRAHGDVVTVCATGVKSARVDVRRPTGNSTSEHMFYVNDTKGGSCGRSDADNHNLSEGHEYLLILESNHVNDSDRQPVFA